MMFRFSRAPASQRDVARRPSRRPLAATVWGDGFVDDGFLSFAAVRDWDAVAEDEYIRVFPQLLASGKRLPAALEAHLATGIAVRAWRLDAGGAEPWAPASIGPDMARNVGRLRHADWFAEAVAPRGCGCSSCSATCHAQGADSATLERLDRILMEVRQDSVRPFDTATAVLFAFEAGIHPVYLWPEALIEHELFFAAGWLGHLRRGRQALMPADLAAYFDDVIGDGEPVTVANPHIARLMPLDAMAAEVRRAARLRQRGGVGVATWRTTPMRRFLAAGLSCSGQGAAGERATVNTLSRSSRAETTQTCVASRASDAT